MQWEKVSSDFELARGLAEAIGLADRPSLPTRPAPFIANSAGRRERTRRPNTGDFQQVGRQMNSRRVRERQQSLREQERVPENAVTMAVSLDGVMLPMKDGDRQAKREQAAAEGKHQRGPAGCMEASCGTLSFYDREGNRLATRRLARMP